MRLAAGISLLIAASTVMAGGARQLGMGGVDTPETAAAKNPAYAAAAFDRGSSVPLPLGAIAFLSDERLDPASDAFDLLTTFDQAGRLDTFLLTPAVSPEEILFTIGRGADGNPTLTIDLRGGSPLLLERQGEATYHQATEIPLGVRFGPLAVAVRPFVRLSGSLQSDAGLRRIFSDGASSGKLAASAKGTAGVALDLTAAFELPPLAPAGRIFIGVRGSPFLGLAKVDGAARATVAATSGANGPEVSYDYQGTAFLASLTEGQLGFGVNGDIGLAVILPADPGEATLGFSVRNLGFERWSGTLFRFSGDSSGNSSSSGTPEERSYLLDGLEFYLNGAYRVSGAQLGVPLLDSVLVAADGTYDPAGFGGHAGVETGFGLGPVTLLARAGLGFDNGFVFGVGSGFRLAGVGIDLALHSYLSPLTTDRTLGISGSLVFGF